MNTVSASTIATCFLVTASLKILGGARKDLGGAKPLFAPLKYVYALLSSLKAVNNIRYKNKIINIDTL